MTHDNINIYQIAVAVVILVAIIVLVSFAAPKRANDNDNTNATSTQTITAQHTFSNGTHTYTGTIDLPTPCHKLSTDTIIRESFPEQVTLEFNYSLPSSQKDRACIQVIDPRPFEIQFEASEQAHVDATLNGDPVELDVTQHSGEPALNVGTTTFSTSSRTAEPPQQ